MMLLFIAFQLPAQVLCTVRDTSLSRLIDEGFGVADEVMAWDSHGFERIVSQFRGPRGPQFDGVPTWMFQGVKSVVSLFRGPREPLIDVVPSWLLGGGEGTSLIRLGARVEQDVQGIYEYEIQGMDNWIIRYSLVRTDLVDLEQMAANELVHRTRHTLPVNIVYFSRPSPETEYSWMYSIRDDGPRRFLLGTNEPQTLHWLRTNRIPFRGISSLIQAFIDWSLLLRRYPHIEVHVSYIINRSDQRMPEDPDWTLVMRKTPEFLRNEYRVIHENVSSVLTLAAHFMHRHAECLARNTDDDLFHRGAFFLDSDSPESIIARKNFMLRPYRFRTLQDVLGDDFQGYDRDYIRSRFGIFVELVKLEWDRPEPNPAAIPSIVDLIEQGEGYIFK
jgi:hypothetical protein